MSGNIIAYSSFNAKDAIIALEHAESATILRQSEKKGVIPINQDNPLIVLASPRGFEPLLPA